MESKTAVYDKGKPKITVYEPSWAFAEEVVKRGGRTFPIDDLKTLYTCIQCGTCVGSCPAGKRTAWRVRSIMRKIQLGSRNDVLNSDDLWACTTCYTCQERCPRAVMTTDLIRTVRNIAFEEGHARERHLAIARNFIKTGHSIPITDEVKNIRVRLGLDPIPPTTLKVKEALDEINKITEITGFQHKLKERGK
jgi:heterodisulfide reductase subunit C